MGKESSLLQFLRLLYFFGLLAVLCYVLITNWSEIRALVQVQRPSLLIVAFLLSIAQPAVMALFWSSGLASLGERVSFWRTLGAIIQSLPARYIPGSVWFSASRAGLLRASGVGVPALGVVIVQEMIFGVLVSVSLGSVLLLLIGQFPGDRVLGFTWIVGLVVLAAPPTLNKIVGFIGRWRGWNVPTISWSVMARLGAVSVVFWCVQAASFTSFLHAFRPVVVTSDDASVILVAGAFLVAWAIGFVTLIAPQGLGVFEVAFVTLAVGSPVPSVVALVASFRLFIVLRDVLLFALGWLSSAHASRSRQASDRRP